jgi:hypothetical protein
MAQPKRPGPGTTVLPWHTVSSENSRWLSNLFCELLDWGPNLRTFTTAYFGRVFN